MSCVNESLALRSLCDSTRRVKVLLTRGAKQSGQVWLRTPGDLPSKTFVEGQTLPINMFTEVCSALFSGTYMPMASLHQDLFIVSSLLPPPNSFVCDVLLGFFFYFLGLYSANENSSLGI